MKKIKLFCFPYAGGSAAAIYAPWRQYLHPQVELVPVELAGRGRRIHEARYADLPAAIEDAFCLIEGQLSGGAYAFFGHSLGGLIAFELAHCLRDRGYPAARHLFFSGKSAPHVADSHPKQYHLMGEEEFKREVMELGGTPPELFEHPELLQLFLPLLRSDFKLAETPLHPSRLRPLDCRFTVFLGRDDQLSDAQCDGWHDLTARCCNLHYFTGGHFFLHQHTGPIVQIINVGLAECTGCRRTAWLHAPATQPEGALPAHAGTRSNL